MDDLPPARRSVIGPLLAAVVVIVLAISAVRLLQGTGPASVHDLAGLPSRFAVCGRDWKGPGQIRTLDAIRTSGPDPVLVDPAPLAPCPDGACTNRALATACATVVYIRVGADAYVPYELVGGP